MNTMRKVFVRSCTVVAVMCLVVIVAGITLSLSREWVLAAAFASLLLGVVVVGLLVVLRQDASTEQVEEVNAEISWVLLAAVFTSLVLFVPFQMLTLSPWAGVAMAGGTWVLAHWVLRKMFD